jgi:hypothetical protein
MHRTIILPVVLLGCETWSLTLREECRLSVFENRVLRRIFGPKRDEVTGEWRRLHNKELYALCSSLNIIGLMKSRKLKWAGHVAGMGGGMVNTGVWREHLTEDHLEDIVVDGRIILKWILESGMGSMD